MTLHRFTDPLTDESGHNDFLDELHWDRLPALSAAPIKLAAVNPQRALPYALSYYHYMGSLTTPPCTQDVAWYVLSEAVSISIKQRRAFTSIFKDTARPTQPIHNRTIYRFDGEEFSDAPRSRRDTSAAIMTISSTCDHSTICVSMAVALIIVACLSVAFAAAIIFAINRYNRRVYDEVDDEIDSEYECERRIDDSAEQRRLLKEREVEKISPPKNSVVGRSYDEEWSGEMNSDAVDLGYVNTNTATRTHPVQISTLSSSQRVSSLMIERNNYRLYGSF